MKITLKHSARLFAIIITAFFLISVLVPSITFAQSEKYKLEGWKIDAGSWTGGNLNPQPNYAELDWVPFRLEVSNYNGGSTIIGIQHDHLKNNYYGYQTARNFKIAKVTNGLPESGDVIYTPDDGIFSVSGPHYATGSGGVTVMEYRFHVSDVEALVNLGNFVFYWEAQLAGPMQSSQWPGASLHSRTTVTGNQDVPISPNKIIPAPVISLEKVGPQYAEIGETIDYTLTVTNNGNVTLTDVIVSDPMIQLENDGNIGDIAAGQSVTLSGSYTIPDGNYPDGLKNTATATGIYNSTTVSDEDSHTVQVLRTGISVTKTGPDTAEVGEVITYTITVTNNGDVDLHDVLVTDAKLGFSETISALAEGASQSFNVTYTVTEGDFPTTENTASASGTNSSNGDTVSDEDSHTVQVLRTGITITKTGPEEADVDETITYTITVTNTGDVDLYNVVITDEKLGFIETIPVLAVGESAVFTIDYLVAEDDYPLLENTAVVTAANQFGSDQVEAMDDHDVLVFTEEVIPPDPPEVDPDPEPEPEPEPKPLPQTGSKNYLMYGFGLLLFLAGLSLRKKELTIKN